MMTIYDAIRHLLAQHGPRIATPTTAWHCTELTAYTVGQVTSLKGWYKPGTQWWRDMNIWDPELPWSPLPATFDAAQQSGTAFTGIVQPESPAMLPDLAPGVYVAQGWERLPKREDAGKGHAFFVEALPLYDDDGEQIGYIVESSRDFGLRISDQKWRGEDDLPKPQRIRDQLRRFIAGVGLAPLYPATAPATADVDTAPTPEPPTTTEEEPMDETKSPVDIDPGERDDILDLAESEFSELVAALKAGTATPSDFIEAGFDIIIKVATALIPGQLDDLAVSFFSGQLDALKAALGSMADKAFGIREDAAKLLARARDRRETAAAQLAKADEREAEGKIKGGLFRRSVEKLRERAAELIALAVEDEAAAAALQAGE